MGANTKIQWAHHSVNPWLGCTKISTECRECYAEAFARRFGVGWGKGAPRRKTTSWKADALRWERLYLSECEPEYPQWAGHRLTPEHPRVFGGSLMDWLDPEVPIEWLIEMLDVMSQTPNLRWLQLTKRPELFWDRMDEALEFVAENLAVPSGLGIHADEAANKTFEWLAAWLDGKPPANVWFGVSAGTQSTADKFVPELLKIPAALRWVSCEPMLEKVDFTGIWAGSQEDGSQCSWCGSYVDSLSLVGHDCMDPRIGVNLIVFGGESGPHARPCNVDWIRDGLRQCREAGVPAYVKQLGAHIIGAHGNQRCRLFTHDRKGGDSAQWPEDLQVREMPGQ